MSKVERFELLPIEKFRTQESCVMGSRLMRSAEVSSLAFVLSSFAFVAHLHLIAVSSLAFVVALLSLAAFSPSVQCLCVAVRLCCSNARINH